MPPLPAACLPCPELLHDDGVLMVVSKPSGLLSVPGLGPEGEDSVLGRICRRYPQARAVHRLDQDTSGLMAVGLTAAAVSALGRQFMRHAVARAYVALVEGLMARDEGVITLPLRPDLRHRPRQMVDFLAGRHAVTCYQVIRRLPEGGLTLVRLFPRTGRTHQLRLHLQQIGHPIVGERLYVQAGHHRPAARLYLHATLLALTHPVTGQRLSFYSPPPFVPQRPCGRAGRRGGRGLLS